MNPSEKTKVVVLGGLGLIGRAVVQKVRLMGLSPVIVDAKTSEDRKGDQILIATDLSRKEAEESLYKELDPFQSRILGWVNAFYPKTATYGSYDYLDDVTDDGVANITLHAGAFYRACRVAVRIFERDGGGSIVNFGSIYGPMGPDMRIYAGTNIHNAAAYAMIKEAIIGLTRYIATCYAQKKIRCNAVCPGGVYDNHDDLFVKQYSERIPMRRMATPEEIASATAFLISEESSYMTGQALMVDGGLSAW